jgi:hypothetical protein
MYTNLFYDAVVSAAATAAALPVLTLICIASQ